MTPHSNLSLPHVLLLFGGQSVEHEISVLSAASIYRVINLERYRVSLVRIGQDGKWIHIDSIEESNSPEVDLNQNGDQVFLNSDGLLESTGRSQDAVRVDVVFPVLHGANGEDGAIQGLLQMYRIPYVGAGILGSSVCMDKDVSKRLLRDAGIVVPKFIVIRNRQSNVPSYEYLASRLGPVLFVKPSNTGSSVGITRVESLNEYQAAVELAFRYDDKVLVEEAITGREIECAILGRNPSQVSICGEIRTRASFYSYEAKYIDESATDLLIPATLPDEVILNIQDIALEVCRILECRGMARVDFFLKENHEVLVNEVNTIPGFTSVSMYPSLWGHTGLSFSDLIDELIQDAFDAHERRSRLTFMQS